MILKAILLLTNLVLLKAGEVIDRKNVRAHIIAQKQEAGDYVVLPLSKMWRDDFKEYSAGKLTLDDFPIIEAQLRLFAEEYNKGKGGRNSIKLSNYKRQYICGINKRGDKEVWVNCFCKGDVQLLKYWKEQAVMVMDGGKCFFNLKINLTKKVIYDVMVSGVA